MMVAAAVSSRAIARSVRIWAFSAAVMIVALSLTARSQAQCELVERHFRINTSSFVSGLSDTIPGLTEDEVEYWVLYAFQQVVSQSGAGFKVVYDGRTTAPGSCQGSGPPLDGQSQIVMQDTGLAFTNGEDICLDPVGTISDTWTLMESTTTGRDPVGALMHEIEHWLGLSHASASCLPGLVCDSQGHVEDTTLDSGIVPGITQRTLTGIDKRRLRHLVRTLRPGCFEQPSMARLAFATQFFSGWVPSSVTLPSTWARSHNGPGATIGRGSSGQSVVVAGLIQYSPSTSFKDDPPGGYTFIRANVSSLLDNVSDFTPKSFLNFPTSHSAMAVAGKRAGSSLWVAAFPNLKQKNYICPGIRVLRSTNQFDTISDSFTLATDCTADQVALEWHDPSQRFIMMFRYQSPLFQTFGSDPADVWNGSIFARTSTDGLNWSAAQFLGKSLSTPGLGCGATTCMFTITSTWGTDRWPRQWNISFTVDSAGTITTGAASTDNLLEASKVDADVSFYPDGANQAFFLVHWGPYPFWADSRFAVMVSTAGIGASPSSYQYALAPGPNGDWARFPPEIAANHSNHGHLFYMR
jgi:hypothetical protein